MKKITVMRGATHGFGIITALNIKRHKSLKNHLKRIKMGELIYLSVI